ncbi:MAG: hypothetical protein IPJ65_32805 [Archangiaceae bacterium]|nr:hypothetical protein [Archangiaceae bacterium]
MLRTALAVVLSAYVALATGDVPGACSQSCPDDDSQGQCAPDCTDCACCLHLRLSMAVAELKVSVPATGEVVPERPMLTPQSPEPGDILHVPKTHLA